MSASATLQSGLQSPTAMVASCIGKRVYLKCRNGRSVTGTLHATDEHYNMILTKVEETGPLDQIQEQAPASKTPLVTRQIQMLFVRGDTVVAMSPQGNTNLGAQKAK
jgi:U6 snRNA-associated Sm-like protein LSm3